MGKVLKADCTSGDAFVTETLASAYTEIWLTLDVMFDSAALTWFANHFSGDFADLQGGSPSFFLFGLQVEGWTGPTDVRWVEDFSWGGTAMTSATPAAAASTWQTLELHVLTTGTKVAEAYVGGTLIFTDTGLNSSATVQKIRVGQQFSDPDATAVAYIRDVKAGTTRGASDIFADDFSSGDTSAWTSATGDVSVIDDPLAPPPPPPPPPVTGRVQIAFDDGPLVANPTWTRIDGGDSPFPDSFVSGYDIEVGRQTLISQTDTGTATVYINDHESGLFDPRNLSSPYYGKLDGRQLLLQLYDPVAATWEDQFRGFIDDITWEIDGSAVNASGAPINASIQLECVDLFDFLAGYGLTPGLDGVTPPAGAEDGVYYAATAGSVDDRIIEVLGDVGIDPSRYTVASGNVHVKAVKYDPDESALQALRDAADAELPFIANIYCDRHGNFQFRGRYSRFDPDAVAAEPGSTWDFTRWAVGDGEAILADSSRAQMRVLAFTRNRSDLINVAIAYPQNMKPADMPGQVWADTASITAYGKHAAPPMSDLLTDSSDVGGLTDLQETSLYAELLVKNQKDPRENVSSLQVKTVAPDDSRAATTWALLTKADISHIINVKVGYPAGTGLTGASPDDDYYIEGRRLRVRPLQPGYDYVECDYDLSPAVWSMDTHSVFPPFSG